MKIQPSFLFFSGITEFARPHPVPWPCLLCAKRSDHRNTPELWTLSHGPKRGSCSNCTCMFLLAASGYRAGSSSFLGRVAPESQLDNIHFRYQTNFQWLREKAMRYQKVYCSGSEDEVKTWQRFIDFFIGRVNVTTWFAYVHDCLPMLM